MNLSDPGAVMLQLAEIGRDLATVQNEYEQAALEWFKAKRGKEHDYAVEFIKAEGTVAQREALATRETALHGMDAEAAYESLKAKVRVLETRSNVLMSVLKAQSKI